MAYKFDPKYRIAATTHTINIVDIQWFVNNLYQADLKTFTKYVSTYKISAYIYKGL